MAEGFEWAWIMMMGLGVEYKSRATASPLIFFSGTNSMSRLRGVLQLLKQLSSYSSQPQDAVKPVIPADKLSLYPLPVAQFWATRQVSFYAILLAEYRSQFY